MNKKLYFLIILFLIQHFTLQAQHELTLFHMNNVFQSTYVNPTSVPEHAVSIGLPGLSSVYAGGVNSSGWVLNDLKTKTSQGKDTLTTTNLINKLDKENNYTYASASVDLFSLRFKVKNIFISLNATDIFNSRFTYTQDLITIAAKGNAPFIGSTVDLNNVAVNSTHYREYGLGFTRAKDGGKFIYGARVKLLQGFENITTDRSNSSVTINDRIYEQQYNSDVSVNTSGMFNDPSNPKFDVMKYETNFKNLGWGLDLGATYFITKKLSVTAAINNIGAIYWQKDTKSYSTSGQYQFNGVNLGNLLAHRDSFSVNVYTDSLKKALAVKETSGQKYTSTLSPQLYLSVGYQLARNTKLAATFYTDFYQGMHPVGSFALTQRVGRVLNVLATYTIRKNSYTNVGFGLMIKPGPFQLYLVGDNIIAALNPYNANNFNLRVGCNLVFGKIKKPDFQSHNE